MSSWSKNNTNNIKRRQKIIQLYSESKSELQSQILNHNENVTDSNTLINNINTLDVIIITKIVLGGTLKYINNLIDIFNNKYIRFTKITNNTELNNYNISSNTIVLVQQLIDTDININTIINIKKKTGCKLILTIHDFSLFDSSTKYNNSSHNSYLYNLIYNPSIQELFDFCSNIIISSQFVKDCISIYKFNDKITSHIDKISDISDTPFIPYIDNYNNINIAVPSNLSEYKGEEFYDKIIKHYTHYIYNDKKYSIKFILFINKEKDILLLYLNKWGETYSYCLSKGLNTGLPILYNNIGSFIERIPIRPYYFPVNIDKYNIVDINDIINIFPNVIEYIIKNNGAKSNNEIYFDIPEFYHSLFNANIIEYLNVLYKENSIKYKNAFKIVQPYAIYFLQFHQLNKKNKKEYNNINNNQSQTPLIGNYNLKYNKYIINTEILIAKANGFKGFGIYYDCFSNDTISEQKKIFENVIDTFFKTDLEDFDVFFMYANNLALINTKDIMIKNISHVSQYFTHNNYRKIDNKPVFMLHHPWNITIDEIDLMYNLLCNKCKELGFDGIYFIINSINSIYNKYLNYNHSLYKNNNINEHPEIITENENNSIIKCCFTNFNNFDNTSNDLYDITKFSDIIDTQFNHYKSNINTSEISRIMLFNAWNRWEEKMVINPTNELGFIYLDTIRNKLLNLS